MAPRYTSIVVLGCSYALLLLLLFFFFFAAASFAVDPAAAASSSSSSSAPLPESQTCVPSLQRMLSCLDFIEHRTDEIPVPCCVQVRSTVAQQPCCLMHVLRGNVAKLLGAPEFDNRRAMLDVTTRCLGDASIVASLARNCSGKPLPPLTPEFTFTTTGLQQMPATSSGSTTRLLESSYAGLLLPFVALVMVL